MYIGQSSNLYFRFTRYYSKAYLENRKNLIISRAINKYGYSNFSLEILEYCEIPLLFEREQYYLDILNPAYNILKIAGSSQGFKYSPETIAKLKKLHSGKLHPRFNTKASEQQKLLTGLGGTKITMRSANGEVLSFPSINATRHHFRIRFTTISLNINQNKPILIKGVKWFVYSETET